MSRSSPSATRTCSTSSTKRGDLPQRRVVRLVAVRRAELVVVVVLDARGREKAVEGLEVLVRRPGPPCRSSSLSRRVVADALGPDAEVALRRGDRDHPHAARAPGPAGRWSPGQRDPASMPRGRRAACGRPTGVAVRVAVCCELTVTRGDTALTGPRLGTRKAQLAPASAPPLAAAGGAPLSDRPARRDRLARPAPARP